MIKGALPVSGTDRCVVKKDIKDETEMKMESSPTTWTSEGTLDRKSSSSLLSIV